jgi:tetratricopeptide (TPR) repeat protein
MRTAGPGFPRLFALLLLAAFLSPLLLQPAIAQQQSEKTVKAPAMSEKVYKRLTEAQELIEAKQFEKGLAVLRDLERQEGMSPYEKAQIYNFYAYTYFTLERYKDAIRAYEQVLAQPELPVALIQNSLYTLAQLYFITEEYRKAIETINRWMKVAESPTETAYMLLGQAYYQLEQYKESLVPLRHAYDMVKARGDQPKENLLLLLRVNHFHLNDYKSMLAVLRELVTLYPKDEYWMTMAGVYSELKQYNRQMSILEMLYERGGLGTGPQQLNLANLYLMNEVPLKAARLLDKGFKENKIERTVQNLRLLSQAWLQAQEHSKSIEPLREAARISKDGDLDVRLAQAYIALDRYAEAVEALQSAMKKGGIDRPDLANVMLGMALFELERFDAARNAFSAARSDQRSRKSAEQWLSYVDSEQTRKRQLEESLKRRRN